MDPFPVPDGHDFPRLVDELVPGLAALGDVLVIGLEESHPIVAAQPIFESAPPQVGVSYLSPIFAISQRLGTSFVPNLLVKLFAVRLETRRSNVIRPRPFNVSRNFRLL